MKKNQFGSFSSSDLIDAKLEEHQLCRANQCPCCGYKLERKVWLGFPAGVKFDPTDQELIEHLEAKVGSQDLKSHPLIDEFIPTIVGEDGICYTHPERLPGVTKDGLSKHFFHRPSKAYTTGTRKRRKIQTECDLPGGETRWHKTGKTRPVMVNGRQKGCKKILVLYTNFGRNRKPEKTNFVMHQYHLGELEEEKEGDLVVSKILYQTQPRQCNNLSEQPSGSGSCSSSKDFETLKDEDVSAGMTAVSSYNVMDHQKLNYDHFSFAPFRKSFDEVGEEEPTSAGRDASYQERDYDQVTAEAYMHVSTPPLNHISRTVLQNQRFQQQHHMLVGRSDHGLEQLLMGCTSQESQEQEWLKYSFWPEPDNSYHHG